MEVTANYNNGKSVVVTDYYVSPLPTTAGEGKVTISYGGKSTTIDVIIKEKEIVKIEVTPPEKTVYFKGEQLDTTGMVVTVYYNNKTSEEVTDYIISGFGDTDETNKVVVSYKEHTASFEVIIHNPTNKWVTTKKATCEDDGEKVMYCTTCDDVIKREVIKAIGHDYSEKVVDPTCTEKGYTEHTCKNCGDTYRDSYVAEKGHNPITDYGEPATCTENGLTEGSHCSVCGKVIKAQKTVAKKKLSKPSSVKATAMTKAFKLNWKKVTDAKGYEIQYSYKSNFSGAKKITVKKGNTTSKTVKKLTGKKKVYIRIRAYYNDKNGKAYSTWVKVNVTTKK